MQVVWTEQELIRKALQLISMFLFSKFSQRAENTERHEALNLLY